MLDESPLSLTEIMLNHANEKTAAIDSGLRVCHGKLVRWQAFEKDDGQFKLVYSNLHQMRSHVVISGANRQDLERYFEYLCHRYPVYDPRQYEKTISRVKSCCRPIH